MPEVQIPLTKTGISPSSDKIFILFFFLTKRLDLLYTMSLKTSSETDGRAKMYGCEFDMVKFMQCHAWNTDSTSLKLEFLRAQTIFLFYFSFWRSVLISSTQWAKKSHIKPTGEQKCTGLISGTPPSGPYFDNHLHNYNVFFLITITPGAAKVIFDLRRSWRKAVVTSSSGGVDEKTWALR